MDSLSHEPPRRRSLQLNGQLLRRQPMRADDKVPMIGQDRTSPHPQAALFRARRKSPPDRPRLHSIELHRGPPQRLLRPQSRRHVMPAPRQRAMGRDLRRTPKAKQLPRPHERRPRSPRIIRQPESIRPHDNMNPNHAAVPPHSPTTVIRHAPAERSPAKRPSNSPPAAAPAAALRYRVAANRSVRSAYAYPLLPAHYPSGITASKPTAKNRKKSRHHHPHPPV